MTSAVKPSAAPPSSLTEEGDARATLLERVAHELRGPSGVTLGAIEEIELALGENAEGVKSLIEMARRSVRRVLRTADRLDRTAQLERGQVAWAFRSQDLRTIVDQAVLDAELLGARKGVRLVVAMPSTPCRVDVDPAWMGVALCEIIMNGIAHAKKVVSVGAETTPDGVVITVTDDGAGFSAPPPPRYHAATSRRGLGLSISLAREVAAAHGGSLAVEVRKGDTSDRGGCVRITLPTSGPAAQSGAAGSVGAAQG